MELKYALPTQLKRAPTAACVKSPNSARGILRADHQLVSHGASK
jgi:hypothetical protein